jgi:hypothetical protein
MENIDKRIKVGTWIAGTWASPHDGWYQVTYVFSNRRAVRCGSMVIDAQEIRFFTNNSNTDLLLLNKRRVERDYIGSIAKA